ncbi:MAG: glycoside hydrolase family 3 C-terminal domain-containing protein [Oscillospiraceae bacterium]|jgi:beta-glucosidase|nr:glycoside hydrolase family 3 C-terminal domain-containing protein [Oscillospiraceae bacterium]
MTEQKINDCKARATELVARMTLAEAATQLAFDAIAIPRLDVPDYNWWNEALHGVARAGTATMFPQAIALAAAFDPELLGAVADAISTEARAKYNAASSHGDRGIYKGLTFWSPNVNIFRDPRWGRGHETYGEDPYLTSRLGVAFVKGLQGDGETLKVAACAKHFAVHSGPEKLRHEFNAVVSQKDLWETYLPAFEACVTEADVEAVMGAYNRTLDEPCCGSQLLLVDILRGKWQFDGHVVSDCWALVDFHAHHKITEDAEHSAALAIKAGCDLNCGSVYGSLMDAYEHGLITEDEIRLAAIRLMTTRFKLGALGDEGSEWDNVSFDVIDSPEHQSLNLTAARESIVLLKNDGLLPLNADDYKSIAVVGPNANSRAALMGNYHGTGAEYVTIAEGIQFLAGDTVRVRYAEGSKLAAPSSDFIARPNDLLAEALATVENSDLTVLVLGLDETIEGEEMMSGDFGNGFEGDKGDLNLPKPQLDLLNAVIATGKPIVVVLMAGSSIDLRAAENAPNVGGIINAWYPGALGGAAVADVLFGEVSPSGKLPVTFYNSADDLPAFTDYAMENRTYRYFTGDVLYPFGYGLTYGDVYAQGIDYELDITDGGVEFTVTVRNRGGATKDVLQVYARPDSPFAPTNPKLVAFKKVEFAPDSTQLVKFRLPDDARHVVNDAGERVRCDELTVTVGFGQGDARTAALYGHDALTLDMVFTEYTAPNGTGTPIYGVGFKKEMPWQE